MAVRVNNIDVINPDYYKTESGKQCIDYITDDIGNTGTFYGCQFNVNKYLFRNGKKDNNPPIQDLNKAWWYFKYAYNMVQNKKVGWLCRRRFRKKAFNYLNIFDEILNVD